jgi:adenylate kinase
LVLGFFAAVGINRSLPVIIFVCGLSHSGKTTTIEAADVASIGFRHLRASAVLNSRNRPTLPLRASEVIPNQLVLVESILKDLAEVPGNVVLDGHLLIETVDGPQLVPEAHLDPLPISATILIQATPDEVVRRRLQTPLAISSEEASDFMKLEAIQARRFARRRAVKLFEVQAGEFKLVRQFLSRSLSAGGNY